MRPMGRRFRPRWKRRRARACTSYRKSLIRVATSTLHFEDPVCTSTNYIFGVSAIEKDSVCKRRTSLLLMSKSFSNSIPRYEKVRKVRFFLSSAANAGSVTLESAYPTSGINNLSTVHSFDSAYHSWSIGRLFSLWAIDGVKNPWLWLSYGNSSTWYCTVPQ